jgi:hypothetical protein
MLAMNQKIKQALSFFLGLGLIILAAYATFRLLVGGWGAYKSLSDNVQIALAAGIISLFGTLYSLYYTKLKEKQLQINAAHREKKQKLYNDYIEEVFEIIMKGEGTEEEWVPVRKKFISNALLWSNDKVLSAFHRMRIGAQDDTYTSKDFAKLILAFREDLGLNNQNITDQMMIEIMYNKEDIV